MTTPGPSLTREHLIELASRPRVVLRPPGPIAMGFQRSRAFIKFCIGPVGSGKTMAALQAGLELGVKQGGKKNQKGILVRKARIGVIRESYPSIESTILKSWHNIIPINEGKFSLRAPYTHHFQRVIKRNAEGEPTEIVEVTFEFRAIGDMSVEEACRGWEVNGVIVDEADIQPAGLISFLTGRVGRFSDLDPSSVVDPQIICVMNMPDIDNHAYQLAMDRVMGDLEDEAAAILKEWLGDRPLIETFIQPGGMEPDAENLHNLEGGRAYYVRQIAANKNKPQYVDRMVHNKPVSLMHGEPINGDFSQREHVGPVTWDRRFKLIVGVDQGQFAAAVIGFRNQMGQWRAVGEVVNVAKDGKSQLKVGAKAFGRQVRAKLLEDFRVVHADQIRVVGDPAMFAASDKPADEYDWRLSFQAALGFPVHRAKTNRVALRHQVIWDAQGERGGYMADPSCRTLIRAHAGGYRYAKATLKTGETRDELEAANTFYTNIADAEQYAALEGEHVISDVRGRPRGGAAVLQFDTDWDPLAALGGR